MPVLRQGVFIELNNLGVGIRAFVWHPGTDL